MYKFRNMFFWPCILIILYLEKLKYGSSLFMDSFLRIRLLTRIYLKLQNKCFRDHSQICTEWEDFELSEVHFPSWLTLPSCFSSHTVNYVLLTVYLVPSFSYFCAFHRQFRFLKFTPPQKNIMIQCLMGKICILNKFKQDL